MTRSQRNCRRLALLVPTALLAMLVWTSAAVADDAEVRKITVSCFVGNTDGGNYLGNVTVTVPQEAGRSCNTTYYECQGKCLGCFPDANRDRQVCYDKAGNKTVK